MIAHVAAHTKRAVGLNLSMLTNAAAPAILAVPLLPSVHANADAPTILASALLPSMHAWLPLCFSTSHKFAIMWRTIAFFATTFMLYALGLIRHEL
jgi:hypothetical protein